MSTEKTSGQVSWTARNMFLAGPGDQPGDVLAELDGTWDYLTPEEREAEEAGAQAVLGLVHFKPGDPDHAAELATLRALRRVTAYFAETWAGLMASLPDSYACHMNCAEANAAADLYRALGDDATAAELLEAHGHYDEDGAEHYHGPRGSAEDDFAADRPDRHADLDAGENGGAMTDADYYGRIAAGEREDEQRARDTAAEDGDLDDCEPTL